MAANKLKAVVKGPREDVQELEKPLTEVFTVIARAAMINRKTGLILKQHVGLGWLCTLTAY